MIEKIFRELELHLSDIAFAGLQNIQPVMVQKLESILPYLDDLQMNEGTAQIQAFIAAVHKNQGTDNESTRPQLIQTFCTLEFYIQTVLQNIQ